MKITDFIFCDDARQEINQKTTLIGIYKDIITFSKSDIKNWPVVLRAALFIRLDLENDPVDEFCIEITNCEIEPFNSPVEIKNLKQSVGLTLYFAAFPIKNPGRVNFNLTFFLNKKIVKEIKPAYFLDIEIH
jgi:hypothetical protein